MVKSEDQQNFNERKNTSPAVDPVMHDIIERRRLEQLLAESEERFRSLAESCGEAILVQQQGKCIYLNRSALDLAGAGNAREIIGKDVIDFIDPAFQPGTRERLRLLEEPGAEQAEFVLGIRRPGGQPVEVGALAMPVMHEGKRAVQILLHSQAAGAHQESEERFRSLVESSPDAIFVHAGGMCTYTNPAGLELLGADDFEQVRSRNILDFVHPDFNAKTEEWIRDIEENGLDTPSRELKLLRMNGLIVDVEAAASRVSLSGRPAVQIVIKDISKRKEVELRLRLQATVLSQVNDAVVAVGRDQRIIFWNNGAERLYNMTAGEAIGRRREDIYRYRWPSPDSEQAAKESLKSTGFLRGENFHILARGGELYVESSVSVLTDWSGIPAGWLAVMRDVTERKTIEQKLRESEERYRSLVESSPDAILVHQSGRIVYANGASLKLFGATEICQIIGKSALFFVHPDFSKETQQWIRQVEEDGLQARIGEMKIVKLDGREVSVDSVAAPITFQGKPATQIITKDITERKKFEQALLNSERLYRLMFESNPHPMWIYDTDTLRFLFVNDAAVGHYGFSREEFLSMSFNDIRPEEGFTVPFENARKIASGLYDEGTWRHRKKDGTVIDVEIISHNLKVEGKDARVVLAHDVSARKRAEAALRDSKLAYQTLTENLPGIVYRVHSRENNRVQFFNKTAVDLTGYRDDELSGGQLSSLESLILAEDRPAAVGAIEQAVRTKKSFTIEYRLRHRNGRIRFMLEQGAPIYDSEQELLYIDGVISDITERKEAEQALRESEERQRAVFDNSPIGIFVKDLEGKFILLNRQLEKWMNIRGEDFLGKTDYDLFPKEVADVCTANDRKVIETLTPAETEEIIAYGGQQYIHLIVKFPLFNSKGEPYAICGIDSDITERKRAEQAIKEARDIALLERNRLETVLNTIPSAVFVESRDAGVILQNKQVEEITGRKLDQGVPALNRVRNFGVKKPDGSAFIPEELPSLRTLRFGETVRDVEMLVEREDGQTITILANAAPLSDAGGAIIASVTVFSDITERKRAEDELKRAHVELEQRVRERTAELAATVAALQSEIAERKRTAAERDKLVAAVESTAEAIVVTDKRGTIQYVNPAFEWITGYHRHEAIGRDLHFLDSGLHEEDFFPRMRETIRVDGVWKGRLINKKKDGTIYYEDCTYSPVKDRTGNIVNYVSIKHDVTEKLRLESIAETVDTMNNIGYVFSGIRHEIGNPVSSLLIIMNLLRKKYETSSKETIREYVDQAISQLERIEYLLTSLKNFNMYENLQIRNISLSSFLEKFVSLVSTDLAKRGIHLEVEYFPPEAWMRADPRALQQALVNVIVNAADAVAERTEPRIVMTASCPRDLVQIRVKDNGPGIPDDRKKELFKPFYTTKTHGTGLGLVITRKLIYRMKGFIEIASRKNEGTVVDIYLPEGTVER